MIDNVNDINQMHNSFLFSVPLTVLVLSLGVRIHYHCFGEKKKDNNQNLGGDTYKVKILNLMIMN